MGADKRLSAATGALVGGMFFGNMACASDPPGSTQPSPSASASAPQRAPDAAVFERLRSSEHRRDSGALRPADLTNRDARVRREAARALARIADTRAVEPLRGLLRDEDGAVVTWAAYGLGHTCKGREPKLVPELVLRAASWAAEAHEVSPNRDPSPLSAIAQSLARCGTPEAERSLRAWLSQPALTDTAALALGTLAGLHERLEDASLVALLDVAARSESAPPHALYAFTRLPALGATVQERLRKVAMAALARGGLARTFAIRALGVTGAPGVEALRKLLLDERATTNERSAASLALRRLGDAGELGLEQALPDLIERGLTSERLLSPTFGPLLTTLEGIGLPLGQAKQALSQLQALPLPPASEPAARRRVVVLRCRAAALLAGSASAARHLLECDPEPNGVVGQLARISVLDRAPLTGARLRSWERFTDAEPPSVRQAALRLLGNHPEVAGAARVLAKALAAEATGTVATAAQILAAFPERGSSEPGPAGAPQPELIQAFQAALTVADKRASVEALSALLDAAGSLQLLSAKPALERYCASDQPTLRQHAERALARLGDKARRCDSFSPPAHAPPEVARAARLTQPLMLALATDIGELALTLDPSEAPVAVQRIVDLVESGYYDAMAVHRVVPGFVVQFGDKLGDGFGDGGQRPLRCETSPRAFEPFDVGMALAGRDTAATQVFVALDRYPRLDGEYAWVGRAGPEWLRVAQGDRIKKVSIRR
ncbi:MAG TPA: HEAT repeat domain-containing protein [Polyangiaceae bacterium]|nr:HEAT repeat domain-containing protein [Polyangiaceae bacterium]